MAFQKSLWRCCSVKIYECKIKNAVPLADYNHSNAYICIHDLGCNIYPLFTLCHIGAEMVVVAAYPSICDSGNYQSIHE